MDELAKLCDQVLIDNMQPSFKEAIDRLLRRGLSREGVMTFIRVKARNAPLVIRQVEAYLDSKAVPEAPMHVLPATVRGSTRTYRGERTADGIEVSVTQVGGGMSIVYTLTPETSLRVRTLHPGGFNWGFPGAAAQQLALAILLDATNLIRVATQNYDLFAWQFVKHWGDRWEIDSPKIIHWLAGIGGFLPREEVARG